VREGRERRELSFSSPPSSSPPFRRLPPQFVVSSSLSPFTVSPVVGRKGANTDREGFREVSRERVEENNNKVCEITIMPNGTKGCIRQVCLPIIFL